ncbi:hypothetical protein CDC46_24650 (plasmid) [Ralstonia solanacearum]|uniref:hypothetical protein n=1 Tax=Ralstonia solanacearum TaxID=305 RepID=UPI001B3B303D|nr:hypothetical protein [Ralstonia solanacearum]AST35225.2 hypothetical protein CDC46_24650 [Ralstonia solanacearum]MDB0509793.1 hypothetical protein [Ralstonia solanacearum]MDB0511864.1 hypothetical protein [Ralstonia solanacearum]
MKVNPPASPGASASSPSAAQEAAGTQPSTTESSGSRTHAAGSPLASLAELSQTRRAGAKRPAGDDRAGSSSEPPRKMPRRSVKFALSAQEAAPRRSSSLVRHPATDDEQASINRRIEANQRSFLVRKLEAKQPVVQLLQSELGAEIARHLPAQEQYRLDAALARLPEARYEHARLLPPQMGGAYLNRDEEALALALAETDSHGVPLSADVRLDRASWLLLAGMRASALPNIQLNARMRRAVRQARVTLFQTLDRAGPVAQAEALRRLIGACAYAGSQADVLRWTREALGEQRFYRLPPGERAGALAELAEHLDNAEEIEWERLEDLTDPATRAERERTLEQLHTNGLSSTLPMMLDAARRISPMPSDAADLLLQSVISMVRRSMPDPATQQVMLDLFETLLPHLQGNARTDGGMALMAVLPELPAIADQFRLFYMILRRPPGTPPSENRLSHLDVTGQCELTQAVFSQLVEMGEHVMREAAMKLLDNQLEPGRLDRFPGAALESLLTDAAGLTVPASSRPQLLSIVERALDALPGERIVRPLRKLLERAIQPPGEHLDAREAAVWNEISPRLMQAWHHLIPRLPAVQRADELVFAVANVPDLVPSALGQLAAATVDEHRAMLRGIGDPWRTAFADAIVNALVRSPGLLYDALHQALPIVPAGQRATVVASLAATLAWAATAASSPFRDGVALLMEEAGRQLLGAVPHDGLEAVLAAFFRRSELPLLPSLAAQHLRSLNPADEGRVLAALTNEAAWLDPTTRALVFSCVTERLAAHASGRADPFARIAHGLQPDVARTWAAQLQTELDAELGLRLASGPRVAAGATHMERLAAGADPTLELRLASRPGPSEAQGDAWNRYGTAHAMIEALRARYAARHA